VEGEVLYGTSSQIPKDLRDFVRPPTPFNRGFEPKIIDKLGKKPIRG